MKALKYSLLIALISSLTACFGGSGGGGKKTENNDRDGDGIINDADYAPDNALVAQKASVNEEGKPFATFLIDANGNVTLETYFTENGDIKASFEYTYDQNSNEIKVQEDLDGDGIVDSVDERTYDSKDNLILVETDSDAGGEFDRYYNFIYEINGRPIASELFDYATNEKIAHSDIVYQNTASGFYFVLESDFGLNGIIDKAVILSYDSLGNLEQVTVEEAGELTQIITYTYDNLGNRLLENEFNHGFAPNAFYRYEYNDINQLTRALRDIDGDGIDSVLTFDYEGETLEPADLLDYLRP